MTDCTGSKPISSDRTDSTLSIPFSSSSLKVSISILAMVSVLLCCTTPIILCISSIMPLTQAHFRYKRISTGTYAVGCCVVAMDSAAAPFEAETSDCSFAFSEPNPVSFCVSAPDVFSSEPFSFVFAASSSLPSVFAASSIVLFASAKVESCDEVAVCAFCSSSAISSFLASTFPPPCLNFCFQNIRPAF